MTTELMDFADAAALAVAELEEATPDESEASLPEVEEEAAVEDGQAESEVSEQTDSQTDEAEGEGEDVAEDEESLFGDLEIEEEETPPVDLESATFELPGVDGSVTLQELKDGYMRTADYTQKTQRLAEDRKTNEKALGFWEALQGNPDAVVRQLAVQVGLIEEGAQAVKAVEFSPITSAEEMEAEIASRVEAAVAEHPSVQEAQRQEALATIDAEFDRISQEAGVPINVGDREVILREAQRRGVPDLELVFTSLMAQRDKKTAEREALKSAAPARPTGTPSSEAGSGPADSFEEAKQRALLEHGLA